MEYRTTLDIPAKFERKNRAFKIIPTNAASPLNPGSGVPLQEILTGGDAGSPDLIRRESPAFKLLAANQRKAEQVDEMDSHYPAADSGHQNSGAHRTSSLPRQLKKNKENTAHHPDFTSRSLPRSAAHRSKSVGDSGAAFKAPTWYKNMYREMHSSMERESQLNKLLGEFNIFSSFFSLNISSFEGYYARFRFFVYSFFSME